MKKQFIFRYEPNISLEKITADCQNVIKSGRKFIQPKNVLLVSSMEGISQIMSPARLNLFNCLIEKQPNSILELAEYLQRDYEEVEKEVRSLEGMGIIKLKKTGKMVQPIALYQQITIEFPNLAEKEKGKELRLGV
jgi:predicted transcriptional regulator